MNVWRTVMYHRFTIVQQYRRVTIVQPYHRTIVRREVLHETIGVPWFSIVVPHGTTGETTGYQREP